MLFSVGGEALAHGWVAQRSWEGTRENVLQQGSIRGETLETRISNHNPDSEFFQVGSLYQLPASYFVT